MIRINSVILKSTVIFIFIIVLQFVVFGIWNRFALNKYRAECDNLNPVEISRSDLWNNSVLERQSGHGIKYAIQFRSRKWKERYLLPQIRDSEIDLIIDGKVSGKSKDISFHKISALRFLFGKGVGGALYQCTFDGPLRDDENILHVRNHNKAWKISGVG